MATGVVDHAVSLTADVVAVADNALRRSVDKKLPDYLLAVELLCLRQV
jgi:hypothetical protein